MSENSRRPMNRREAVRATTALVGGVWVTANGFLVACTRSDNTQAAENKSTSNRALSTDDQGLIEDIADTLLPTTASSPGAKAAGAGEAINLLLTDCYDAEAQQKVVNGLKQFRDDCTKSCGSGGNFSALSQADREKFLRQVDAEAQNAGDKHYFNLVRSLSTQAYFSSEIGMTKALRYVMVPGKWVGCVPLQPGQPAWA